MNGDGDEHNEELDVEAKSPDAQLLSDAIRASGLSVRRFAAEVLVREPRTVWRWLASENPLPWVVRERCKEIVAKSTGADPLTRDG